MFSSTVAGGRQARRDGWQWRVAFGLLVLLGTLPSESFSPQQFVTTHRFLDDSWRMALPAALDHNQISGRDLTFNYGPTYQVLHALGWIIPGRDAASLMRFHGVLETVFIVAACWWLTRSTPAPGHVSKLFFMVWVVILAAPGDFRATWFKPMAGLAPLALGAGWLVSSLPAEGQRMRWPWGTLAAWSLAPAVMSSYSFEMGPLTLAAEALTAVVIVACPAVQQPDQRRRLRWGAGGAAVGAMTVFAGLVAALHLHPVGRQYWQENLSLVASYPRSWAASGRPQDLALLCLPLPVAVAALVAATTGLKRCSTETFGHSEPAAWLRLIGAAVYAAVLVRYGLTRSDIFHVWRAVAPCLFVGGVMLPCMLWNWRTAAASDSLNLAPAAVSRWPRRAALALPAVLLLPWVFTHTFSAGWQIRLLQLSRFSPAPARFVAIDPVVQSAVDRVKTLPGPDLVVWPYGAMINVLAGRRNPVPTIHPIESHNATLAAHTLRNLGAAPHAPVLLFTAGIEPDGMSNVTRTAPIFRYLLENYRLAFPVEFGQALLLPRKTPVRWRERRIEMAPITFEPLEGRGLSVPVLTDACRASDLLLLRLRIARTAMFGFRKPGRAFAMLVLDDGQRIVRPFPTSTDGEPYEVLLTGMELNDPLLLAAFATERGRLVSQQRVQEIQLAWRPLDLLSVQPAEMEILGLSVLTPEEPPRPGTAMQIDAVTEIALDQRWQPSVWRKFFQQSPPRPAQPR